MSTPVPNAADRENALRLLAYTTEVMDEHLLVSVTDLEGRILYANTRFCTVSGYTERELIGNSHRLINSGAHDPPFFQELWETISSGRVWRGVIRNRTKQGRHYWVNTSIVPILDERGLPARYVSIRDDVTALKEMELRLAGNEARLLALSTLGSDWYWRQDADLRFQAMPADLHAATGMEVSEFDGLRRWELPWEGVSGAEMLTHRKSVEAHEPFLAFTYAIRKQDGTRCWITTSGMPTFDAAGAFLGYHGVARDVTREQELRQRLRAGNERLRLALNASAISLWDWDVPANAIYLDERWGPMVGDATWPQCVDPAAMLSLIHPDDKERVFDAARQLLAGDRNYYDLVHRVRHRDGHYLWIRSRGEVVQRDAADTVIRCAGSNVDVSREKLLEKQLLQAKEEAELASMRDPLTGIANRRALDLRMTDEVRRCQRDGRPLSVLLIDVDFFKSYNDHYGHLAGDSVLRQISGAVQACMRRAGDLAARFGGEEFVVMLPDCDLAGAAVVAQAVHGVVGGLAIEHSASTVSDRLTVSIGIASSVADDAATLFAAADRALYSAKAAGRNTTSSAPSPGEASGASSHTNNLTHRYGRQSGARHRRETGESP